ncbi:Endo-1,4-beta-xylanase A precursor [compost metagenome]
MSAAPAGTVGKAGYSLSVTADGKEIKNVGTGAVIRFPIPAGTADAELLGVYVPDSSGNGWTYAGGREGSGKLELKTGGTGVFLVVQSTLTFPDIASHWAKHDIEVMASRHIVKGVSDTQFAPNTTITRAEFAALLARTLQLETTAGTASFTDVAASSWYAGDVAKAAAAGLIKGDGGKFRPNDTITRQEMAVMIERAAKLKGAASSESGSIAFSDVTSIQAWAKEAVENVNALGIIKGRPDGSFGPAETATRAEAAAMLLKLMNLLEL